MDIKETLIENFISTINLNIIKASEGQIFESELNIMFDVPSNWLSTEAFTEAMSRLKVEEIFDVDVEDLKTFKRYTFTLIEKE